MSEEFGDLGEGRIVGPDDLVLLRRSDDEDDEPMRFSGRDLVELYENQPRAPLFWSIKVFEGDVELQCMTALAGVMEIAEREFTQQERGGGETRALVKSRIVDWFRDRYAEER